MKVTLTSNKPSLPAPDFILSPIQLKDYFVFFHIAEGQKTTSGMDDGVLLLTVSVFIVSSPKDVICVPNLIKPCAEIFKKAWDSDDIMVIIFSVFNHTKSY